MRSRVRGWRRVMLAVALVGVIAQPGAAVADRRNDERTDMVRRQVALAVELDELTATDAELTDALATLDLWMAMQTLEVERTQAELAEATRHLERIQAAEAAKAAEVAHLEMLMATMAVNAYVNPPAADTLDAFRSSAAPADAARLVVYLDVQAERDTDVVHRLRQARTQLERLRERARATERRAATARDDAESTYADLSSTRDRFAELQAEVHARQLGATHEATLVALDLGRSNERLAADAAAERTRGVPLENVRGIRVHRSISGQVELLLAAAEADGIRLGGGGFRTHAEQIHLRRVHCGEDPYAIYEMPPDQCSPPTARPGNSMHEVGLAIDFTYNGAIIGSRTSPGYRWLAENAHLYGLFNLPSEPWHWSVNGS